MREEEEEIRWMKRAASIAEGLISINACDAIKSFIRYSTSAKIRIRVFDVSSRAMLKDSEKGSRSRENKWGGKRDETSQIH